MSSLLAYLLVALATIFWGANFNLSKPVLAEMAPLAAATVRFVVAAVLLVAIGIVRGKHPPWRQHLAAYFMLGMVGVGGFNLLFFFGMQSTSAVNGALIIALSPLLTSVAAHFMLGEQLHQRQWLALPIAVAGVAVVLFGGGAHIHIVRGDVLMLVACMSWTAYNLMCRRLLPKGVDGLTNTTGIMTCGAAILVLAAVINHTSLPIPSIKAGSALMEMTLGGTVISYTFWNAGIERFGAARTALFMNLVPVSSMLIATISGVSPTMTQLFGGAIVIGAVFFSSVSFSSFHSLLANR